MLRVVVVLCGGVAGILCAACLVPGDPLGGPHGGTGGYVPPDSSSPDPDGGPPPEDSGGPTPDSSGPDAKPDASPDTAPPAPSWGDIFARYVARDTKGNCGGCHGLDTPTAAYQWLQGRGQIAGTGSSIVTTRSDFSWFGGFMPPGGPRSYPDAEADMRAWVAAGANED